MITLPFSALTLIILILIAGPVPWPASLVGKAKRSRTGGNQRRGNHDQ